VEQQVVVGRLLVRRQLGEPDMVGEVLERVVVVESKLERSILVEPVLERQRMVGWGVGWIGHALGALVRSVGEHALG
jgi:hypothetical protein